MWSKEYSVLTTAAPAAIWALFKDVRGWPRWNAGIERIEHQGVFAAGETFVMQPPGQDAFTSRLVEVVENVRFTDETRLGEIVVTVDHRIEADRDGTRITYGLHVTGPDAAEVGMAVSEDFPEVLAALAAMAERGGPSRQET